MKNITSLLLASLLIFSGCSRNSETAERPAEEPEAMAVTRWTERTELFMEHPPLVAGETARFAVHLTELRGFQAVTEGRVTVELRGTGGKTETFVTEKPSRPGIFGVDVKPSAAGAYTMRVRLDASSFKDVHETGAVQVYATAQEAAQAKKEEEVEAISFLKEQQWALEFATEVAAERVMREGLRIPAEVRPRTGGEAQVAAPVAGRLVAPNGLPPAGSVVQKGQILARVIPRTSTPLDRATLDLEFSESQTALAFSKRDRERAERLVAAGAAPTRRLDEARAAEATAQARVDAARVRIAQHESSRDGDGETPANSQFVIRAPISGTLAAVLGTAGATVEEGQSLFQIIATDTVFVVASVPEAEAARLRSVAGGELEIAGESRPRPLGRMISIGRVVDAQSRTFPVVFELQNAETALAVGQSVFVRIFTKAARKVLTIPESALVDDGGRPVVFVQLAGESFARQPVSTGSREGGYVEVSGIQASHRVVTRGAYQVRLAALSTQIPAHGHVH